MSIFPYPISAVLNVVGSVINKIWPDKTEQERQKFLIEIQAQLMETQLAKGQIEVNAAEAENPNLFVSGWRPFIGWCCGLAFCWAFLGQPLFVFALTASGHPIPALPALDTASMISLLMGILGLGGLRTFEKLKGVSRA